MTDKTCLTVNCTTRTENVRNVYEIKWEIPKFGALLRSIVAGTQIIVETVNSPEESMISRIRLKMQIVGIRCDYIVVICYYLFPIDAYLSSQLKVYNKHFQNTIKKEYQTVLANKWQCLTNWTERFNYEPIGCLKLDFLFKNDLEVNEEIYSEVPHTKLSGDIENLLNNGLFADITVKSAEGKEFKVHKLVLASRSEVIKAFFEHDNIQSSTNILESPFESEVLEEVLTFIYSDKAPRVEQIADKLLVAADYYQLNKLKSLCAVVLLEQLTVDNAMETLHLAHKYSVSILKRSTLEFIKEDQDGLITKTEGWKKFDSAELLKEIYKCRYYHRSK